MPPEGVSDAQGQKLRATCHGLRSPQVRGVRVSGKKIYAQLQPLPKLAVVRGSQADILQCQMRNTKHQHAMRLNFVFW